MRQNGRETRVSFEIEAVGFPGYYDSLLWDSDNVVELLIEEMECTYDKKIVQHITDQSEGALADLLYLHADKEQYMQDTNEKWMNAYQAYIPARSLSPSSQVEMQSPSEYNWRTDRIFANASIESRELQSLLDRALQNPKFEAFIQDHFSSTANFQSNYSNELNLWSDIDEIDDLQVSYLLYFSALENLGNVKMEYGESATPESILNQYIYEDIEGGVTMDYLLPEFYTELEKKSWATELVASPEWQAQKEQQATLQIMQMLQSDIVREAEATLGADWRQEKVSDDNEQSQKKSLRI